MAKKKKKPLAKKKKLKTKMSGRRTNLKKQVKSKFGPVISLTYYIICFFN